VESSTTALTVVSLQAPEISEQMRAQDTVNYALMGTKGTRNMKRFMNSSSNANT